MLGIGVDEVVSILKLGFSGVAFIFLYMSFSLVSKEQQREGEPRDKILSSIRSFSFLSFTFAVLVLIATGTDYLLKQKTLPEQCNSAMQRAELLAENVNNHDVNSMRELLKNTIAQCE
jgi:hypothetical protein